jgi:hypothetical protein
MDIGIITILYTAHSFPIMDRLRSLMENVHEFSNKEVLTQHVSQLVVQFARS